MFGTKIYSCSYVKKNFNLKIVVSCNTLTSPGTYVTAI